MAPELDMGIGMGMGFSMEAFSSSTNINSNVTTTNPYYGLPSTDALRIDDLLNFDTQDGIYEATNDRHYQHHLPHSSDRYSTSTAGNCLFLGGNDHNNGNSSAAQFGTFSDDLYMPSEEAAELEWLSKFVEDSFSDVPLTIPVTNGNFTNVNPPVNMAGSNSHHQNTTTVPGRARSKRSRAPGQPSSTHLGATTTTSTWSSLSPQLSSSPSSSSSSSSDGKQRSGHGPMLENGNGGVRKCTHCSSEKTPQWRTGPLGPKTLCNACGVRYKSGRLVPEYRPAASPTFVLTQHSNSHRKVIELRRQKELLFRHQHQQHQHCSESSPSNATNATTTRPDLLLRDYGV